MTKNWVETAARKFTVGSSEIAPPDTVASGTLAMIQELIAALAAVRIMNSVVTARITQMRLLWAHSPSSLRNKRTEAREAVG